MEFQTKQQKNLSLVVFGVYLILLIWLILFKFATSLNDLSHIRNINLIPFGESTIVNGKIELSEIIYNILVFVPLGVYISIFKPNWSLIKKVTPCLCLSLVFEILQYIFAIGASDITDVIVNTLGGFIGLEICIFFKKIFKEKCISVVNVIGLVIEIIALLLFGILFIANM